VTAARHHGDDDTLTKLIDALQPVTADDWNRQRAALPDRSGAAAAQGTVSVASSSGPKVEVASGTLDGASWRLTTQGPTICVEINSSAGTCASPNPTGGDNAAGFPTRIMPITRGASAKAVLYAQTDPSVTRVVVTLPDGTEHEGTFIYRDPVGGSGYVLLLLDMPIDPNARAKLVAYRADGSPQSTATVPLSPVAAPPAAPSTAIPRAPTTSAPSK
jgi:hypothetical protein